MDDLDGQLQAVHDDEPPAELEVEAQQRQVSDAALKEATGARVRRLRAKIQKELKECKDEQRLREFQEIYAKSGGKPPPGAEEAKPEEPKGPDAPSAPPAAPPVPLPSISKEQAAAALVGMVIQGIGQTIEAIPALAPLSLNGTMPVLELSERGIAFVPKDKATALAEAWTPLVAYCWDVEPPKWLTLGAPVVFTTAIAFGPGIREVLLRQRAAKAEAAGRKGKAPMAVPDEQREAA